MTEFILPVRVYWEDTDASGVVYHANYLRWMERARSEWLRARGKNQETLRVNGGVAFTIAKLEIRYLQPARLDDELEVTVAINSKRRASMMFHQRVRRATDGVVLAEAMVKAGSVNMHTFKPCPMPEF